MNSGTNQLVIPEYPEARSRQEQRMDDFMHEHHRLLDEEAQRYVGSVRARLRHHYALKR